MLTLPPRPDAEELDPALISTDPPLPTLARPADIVMFPPEPPREIPVYSDRDPAEPLPLSPLPSVTIPLLPALPPPFIA